MTKKSTNKEEIKWNIINACLAGGIAFLSSLATGIYNGITFNDLYFSIGMGIITGLLVSFVKFKEYWEGEKKEYSSRIFRFV